MRWLLPPLLLLPLLALAARPERPELPDDAPTLPTGARLAVLAPGEGAPAKTGDAVEVDLTAWGADGAVLLSTHDTGTRLVVTPGDRAHAPALEDALVGARPGAVLALDAVLAEGAPAARVLLEVRSVTTVRRPPAQPPTVPETAWQERPSGLRVADLEPGTGTKAERGDTVTVDYAGWLVDGKLFDSSLLRATPFAFTLGAHEVIPGWEEGVEGLQVGAVRVLEVPYKLGYGSAGNPPTIPRKATLIFEVRLLDVRKR